MTINLITLETPRILRDSLAHARSAEGPLAALLTSLLPNDAPRHPHRRASKGCNVI